MDVEQYLETYCDELTPREFYRLIFPEGELEEKGVYESGKYCGIAVAIGRNDHTRRFSVTDDLDTIDELAGTDDFCIMSPISYAGKSRKSQNARFIYALAIDVDGIVQRQLEYDPETGHHRLAESGEGKPAGMVDMFYQFDGHGPSHYLPRPTALVSSGSGVHVYYVFEKPIPCFSNIIEQLKVLKTRLTWQYWTQGLSTLHNNVQYESLFQGFRMPGTITKNGRRARAFLVDHGDKVTVEYLNQFVPQQYRTTDFTYKSTLTRSKAREKYPEWYRRRIEQGEVRGRWHVKRALYDWWLRTVKGGAKLGGRYWAVHALATYAAKCDISFTELERDAIALVPILDELTEDPVRNPFTEADARKALEAYTESYVNYPRDVIEARTMIRMPVNKRNGRKQTQHMEVMRAIESVVNPNWRNKDGRPKGSGTAHAKVQQYRQQHPEGTKKGCQDETGLSYPTIRKWWDVPLPSPGFIEGAPI